MRRIIIASIICLIAVFQTVNAQTTDTISDKKNKKKPIATAPNDVNKVEIFRDRLIIDVFHAFWLGVPKEVNNKKFNPGFAVSVLWDFKLPNKGPITFGLGLGMSYYSQFSNALLQPNRSLGIMQYNTISDSIIKFNRLNYLNCYIPFEVRYRHKNGFKISLGVRIGLIAEISQTYKGQLPDSLNISTHYKTYDISNKQKFNFDTYIRIGWKFVNVYYSYQINKLFEKEKGPQISPMSLGISLSIF